MVSGQLILLPSFVACLILCFSSLARKTLLHRRKSSIEKRLPLPPGPKPIPLLGNSLQLPKAKQWETFTKWADQYGDVMHLSAAGRDIIVLSSPEHIHELLNNRASIYSDRPILPMAGKLVGFDQGVTMAQEGKWHREVRKLFASSLNSSAVKGVQRLQEEETLRFLSRLQSRPDELRKNIRHFSSSMVLRVAYGYVTEEDDDPMVATATQALTAVSIAAQPGRWLVDIFPSLMYLPSWLPGAGFKRQAAAWRKHLTAFYKSGFEWVESRMAEGKAPPSHLADRLINLSHTDTEARDILLHSSVAIYGGGSDTMSSHIATFFLYMILYPKAQRKAQQEIDSVISPYRLPTTTDRPRLPYVNAILKECLGILPVTPLGAPHCLREEDSYLSYRIPKKSVVYANIWRIMHNPTIYEDPHTFRPERHLRPHLDLDPVAKRIHDPSTYAFGFGRRSCPGQYLAEPTIFLIIAATLSVFEIRNAPGQDMPVVDCTTGAFSHPTEFGYQLVPRSKGRQALVSGTAVQKGFRPAVYRNSTAPS